MKKIFTTLAIILIARFSHACYADYTYSHGCVGDTVFFQALDGFAAYTWNYGDTAAGSINISHEKEGYHVYTTPGDYYVTLFVNVGAEWDYRTNLVHIGTTCFAARFETQCSSSLYTTFSDRSYGAHSSQQWNFGDPASGAANTDTAASPMHRFSAEGNYVITYIIGNGTQYDTFMQSINVDSTCTNVYMPNFTAALNCVTDTIKIQPSFSGPVANVFWDFNDPASGIANYSTALIGKHVFSAPGNYLVSLIYSNGIFTDTIRKLLPVIDCNVWAGDANSDGEVNGEDIFPIGLYYASHGPKRTGASNTWAGQACTSWFKTNTNGLSVMYLQDLVDMQMADCNGDSTINATDVATIQTNYGRKHVVKNNRSAMLVHALNDPTLAVQLTNATVNAGGDIVATISLGTAAVPAGATYGGSFTLLFDPAKIAANAMVNFSLGWLDSIRNNLITFSHESYSEGKLEIAFVKTNHLSKAGYGPVATVTFHTKPTASGACDIALAPSAKIFNNNIDNFSGTGNIEGFRTMYLQGASATIQNTTGINERNNSIITIYPNPSNGAVFIQHEKINEQLTVEIFNSMGQKVMSQKLALNNTIESLQLSDLTTGLYHVALKNVVGEIVESKKIALSK